MLSDSTKAHLGVSNLKQPNVVDDSDFPTKAHLGVSNLKQPSVVDDSDSLLSSFSSNEDLPDPEESEWQLKDGLFVFKDKLYVQPGVLRCEAVGLNHDNPLAGHFGYLCTFELVRQKYHWPGISRNIKEYVNKCDTCHRIKPVRHKLYGTSNFLPQFLGPFTDLTKDSITDILPYEYQKTVYDFVFLVLFRYTKMA